MDWEVPSIYKGLTLLCIVLYVILNVQALTYSLFLQFVAFSDREIECKDCGDMFLFSSKEQAFYDKKGFSDMVRCKPCIQSKRERMALFDKKGVTSVDEMNKKKQSWSLSIFSYGACDSFIVVYY